MNAAHRAWERTDVIILTNCLTGRDDEGCLKVANSLIDRIRLAEPAVTVVSCGGASPRADVHLPANKLMLSPKLWRYLRKRRERVLYIPAFARMLPTALRIFVLSKMARCPLQVLLAMQSPIGRMAKLLLRLSGAQLISLSAQSHEAYRAVIGEKAIRLRAGVDTAQFVPAPGEKAALRRKYGIPEDKLVVLHVGHMAAGRNIGKLLLLDERFHAVLVVSTQTLDVADEALRAQLAARSNITIIDDYIPQIEGIYQLADAYLFPVEQACCCIDVPLSAMEAASCGIPVVATPYGELRELLGQEGFYRIDSFESDRLNALLYEVCTAGRSGREHVLAYDWDNAVAALLMDAQP